MLHLWLQLYGVNEDGCLVIEEIRSLLQEGRLRFGFRIVSEIPDHPPPTMVIGQNLLCTPHSVVPCSNVGTHVLVASFAAGDEYAALYGVMLIKSMHDGDMRYELTVQDVHVRHNPTPPHMRGTTMLFWEFWLKPGADGTPRVELPAPPGPPN